MFCRLFGCLGIFLPEVLHGKKDWSTPFQDTVTNTGVGQVWRGLESGQFQVDGDYHGPADAVAAVYDKKHLFHRILGAALYTQSVNDKQVIFVKAGDKVGPVLVEHLRQVVQDGGKFVISTGIFRVVFGSVGIEDE